MAAEIEYIFPFLASIISLLFCLSVFFQYYKKKKSYQLYWSIALFFFVVTTGCEALAFALGYWEPFFFRIYYVLAAVQVALLGAGTISLMVNRNVLSGRKEYASLGGFALVWLLFAGLYTARTSIMLWVLVPALLMFATAAILFVAGTISGTFSEMKGRLPFLYILFTVYVFVIFLFIAIDAPVDTGVLLGTVSGETAARQGWIVTGVSGETALPRMFSPLFTVTGAIALIGGPIYSYAAWQWSIRMKSGNFHLSEGFFNIYLGMGAIVFSAGGVLTKISGFEGVLYISNILGILLMYYGFIESDKLLHQRIWRLLPWGKRTAENNQ
ncbi:MAG TPA: hypothetical protein VJ044_04835 [Candidatus Hodarchaeales archaeon]|nr:hypothetical protein [Candidatus Hodarchaeales archaeon]